MPDDPADGIAVMRERIQRAARRTPTPRRPIASDPLSAPAPAPAAPPVRPAPPAVATAPPAAARRRSLTPDLPPVNLAIRVRRPLDDDLVDLIHRLRQNGARTSKVELIEMLLWELATESLAEVRSRIGAFRAAAPRRLDATTDL